MSAETPEILQFTAMVDYQVGSVVSRQIMKAKAGNITLFAFDQGQELSEHSAPYEALLHVVEGEAQVTISGKPFHLATGSAIVLPANEPHAVKAVRAFKMLLTMIRE